MPLTEEVMHTQLYDKVDEYKTLDTNNSYKQELNKSWATYNILFDFETVTS